MTNERTSPSTPLLHLLEQLREPGSLFESNACRADWGVLLLTGIAGSAVLGLVTGLYGMSALQTISSMVKLPIVLFGTVAVCFPTFFVIQYAISPRPLPLRTALQLQITSLAVISLIWAIFALPLAVLLASSESYMVVKWLVTLVAATGGLFGASFFWRAYRDLSKNEGQKVQALGLFPYWVIFGLVGAQLAWNLRPFLGSPSQGFVLFRALGGSLIENLLGML